MSEPAPQDAQPRSFTRLLGELSLALYALLLVSIVGASLLCTGASLWGIVQAQSPAGTLLGGTDLDPQTVALLRARQVLGPDQTPLLYHDDSPDLDGSAGCLVAGQELVRWEANAEVGRVAIPGARVEGLAQGEGLTVQVVQGERAVRCPFGPEEGGERFVDLLQRSAAGPTP